MKRWILICDASNARILEQADSSQALTLVHAIPNPAGRAREQELATDEAGRMRKGSGRFNLSAMDPKTTAHDAAAERFAKHLAALLDETALRGSYDQLVVAAPPHMLGMLRDEFSAHVSTRLKLSVAKDLTHVAAGDLAEHLEIEG